MNDFGDFLYLLRKEKGMTQAELAHILGVTNKAVSKWETGEAMPETGLLIPISRIFGVSVDELLSGKRNGQAQNNTGDENGESMQKNLFTRSKEDGENKTLSEVIKDAVCSVIVFGGILTYLILGIAYGLWHPYWAITTVCAMVSGIVGCIFDLCNATKREKKLARGDNPYSGSICGIVMLLCVSVYVVLGAFFNLWHPLWIIPVAGGFSCGIIAMIAEIINHKSK